MQRLLEDLRAVDAQLAALPELLEAAQLTTEQQLVVSKWALELKRRLMDALALAEHEAHRSRVEVRGR
jgi:hypothetical protein